METEQDVLEEHEEKVCSYWSRLVQMLEGSEPIAASIPMNDPSQHLPAQMREVFKEAQGIMKMLLV